MRKDRKIKRRTGLLWCEIIAWVTQGLTSTLELSKALEVTVPTIRGHLHQLVEENILISTPKEYIRRNGLKGTYYEYTLDPTFAESAQGITRQAFENVVDLKG